MAKSNIGELIFFWIMFAVVGYLSYSVMSPYVTSLFLAIVFAILFAPIHRYFLKLTKGSVNVASLLTVIVALVMILIPIIFLGVLMFQEVFTVYGALTSEGNTTVASIDRVTSMFESHVRTLIPSFQMHANVSSYLEELLRWFATNLNTFFSGILSFLLQCFIIVVAMFFLYRDGKRLRDFAIKWSPLADNYDVTIIGRLETAVSSVVKGALVTAIVQGALVGVGFAIFGVANPVLWGVVSTIVALIPVLGTAIVLLPAAFFFILTHHLVAGIGLIIWWVLSVGIIEHAMRPLLIRRDVDIHPFVILLSVLGGLVYFGPIGFLSGPLVLAFFFALLEIYPAIIKGKPIRTDAPLVD